VLGRPAGPVALPVDPDVELRRQADRPVEFHQRPEQRSLLLEVEGLAGVEAATEALQLSMVQRRLPLSGGREPVAGRMIAGKRVDRSRFSRAQERIVQTGVSRITLESTATGRQSGCPRVSEPLDMFGGKVRTTTGGLLVEYEAGDVIWYRPFGGGLRRVIVDGRRLADVKHGRPGFDGIVVSGPEKGTAVWGYDDQIVLLQPVRNDGHLEEHAPLPADGLSREAARRHGPPGRAGRRAG
jgi:hypothetical protein